MSTSRRVKTVEGGLQSQNKGFRACGEPWNFTMAGSFNAASKSRPAPIPSVRCKLRLVSKLWCFTNTCQAQSPAAPRSVI